MLPVIVTVALSMTTPTKTPYANTVSVWSTTTRTSCPHSQRQRRRRVRVVNDYFSMCLRNHDYMDTQISNIFEKTKMLANRFCYSFGAQVEFFFY